MLDFSSFSLGLNLIVYFLAEGKKVARTERIGKRTMGSGFRWVGLHAKFRCLIINAIVLDLERFDRMRRIDF